MLSLDQLCERCLDGKTKVGDLLRLTKAVAKPQRLKDLEDWVDDELSGYASGRPFPAYRKVQGQLKAYQGGGWRAVQIEDPQLKQILSANYAHQSVDELETLEGAENDQNFIFPFPHEVIEGAVKFGLNLPSELGVEVTISEIRRILSAVRNELLARALSENQPSSSAVEPDSAVANKQIFLSHAASDAQIALLLKQEIERMIPGISIFCSSDPTDLPLGTKWSPEIQRNLEKAAVLILVTSSRSLKRPWVWFECGAFWFGSRRIIPLCFGEIRKEQLTAPLSERQAANGEDVADLKILMESISRDTGLKVKDLSQLDRLAARLAALEREAAEDPDDKAGWFGAEWQGKFLAYDGPYEGLRAIEDEVFDSTMQTALESAGYHVVMVTAQQLAGARSRRFRLVQLTDRKLWRRRVANTELLLVARPKE